MPLAADLHFRLHHRPTPPLLTFPHRLSVSTLLLPRLRSSLKLKLTSPLHCRPLVTRRNLAVVVASGEENVGSVNGTDDKGVLGTEDDKGLRLEEEEKKRRDLKNRVVFGIGIGVGAGGVVLTGGLVFAGLVAGASFMAAREYFEMVQSQGIAMEMTPPPRYVSQVCSAICILMPLLTLCFVNIDVSVTSSAFILAMALILQREKPRFTQLSSAIFGLFYCGYLPCFWVKLRCSLAVPSLNTKFSTFWPILLGGTTHWTVGLCATLISISSIIAADTFAFLGGKFFGHTPLTNISPKKTLEGAFAGLTGCVCTAVILSRILCWPTSLLRVMPSDEEEYVPMESFDDEASTPSEEAIPNAEEGTPIAQEGPPTAEEATPLSIFHPSIDKAVITDKSLHPHLDDLGWKYGIHNHATKSNYIKCLLCANTYISGVGWLKQHLTSLTNGTSNVVKCANTTTSIICELTDYTESRKRKRPQGVEIEIIPVKSATETNKGKTEMEGILTQFALMSSTLAVNG